MRLFLSILLVSLFVSKSAHSYCRLALLGDAALLRTLLIRQKAYESSQVHAFSRARDVYELDYAPYLPLLEGHLEDLRKQEHELQDLALQVSRDRWLMNRVRSLLIPTRHALQRLEHAKQRKELSYPDFIVLVQLIAYALQAEAGEVIPPQPPELAKTIRGAQPIIWEKGIPSTIENPEQIDFFPILLVEPDPGPTSDFKYANERFVRGVVVVATPRLGDPSVRQTNSTLEGPERTEHDLAHARTTFNDWASAYEKVTGEKLIYLETGRFREFLKRLTNFYYAARARFAGESERTRYLFEAYFFYYTFETSFWDTEAIRRYFSESMEVFREQMIFGAELGRRKENVFREVTHARGFWNLRPNKDWSPPTCEESDRVMDTISEAFQKEFPL